MNEVVDGMAAGTPVPGKVGATAAAPVAAGGDEVVVQESAAASKATDASARAGFDMAR